MADHLVFMFVYSTASVEGTVGIFAACIQRVIYLLSACLEVFRRK